MMSDMESKAASRLSEPIGMQAPVARANRLLVMKPKSFFSNEFYMEYEEDDPDSLPSQQPLAEPPDHDRLRYLNLILMIALIGLPLLIYSVLSSAE